MAVIINEVCGGTAAQPKNIGKKQQCLEAPVKTFALAKEGFAFDSVDDAKDIEKWKTAIQNKDIVPFILVEGIEANNTEESVKNGRYKDYTLKEAIRGSSYRLDLSICTYAAVKSYENSDYTRIFRITAENEFTAQVQDDGKVKGEAMAGPIRVGVRNEATDEDVAFANVLLKYKSDTYSILKPSFEVSELEGIYDVSLVQVSASATSIKVKVVEGCTGEAITTLTSDDFVVNDDSGDEATVSFVEADSNGVYEFTGTGFTSGYTVDLTGVIVQTEDLYESTGPLTITIS